MGSARAGCCPHGGQWFAWAIERPLLALGILVCHFKCINGPRKVHTLKAV